jgi:AcrR family transcriptional regulator
MPVESKTAEAGRDDARRELSGEKVQRIVDAMRHCVAERGIAGATFEHVSRQAGVSRGLLHYYFGTKERLLIEVLRNDAETRIAMLDEPLAAAKTADDVVAVLVSGAEEVLREDPGFYVILYELFTAGRQNPEIQAELAELYHRSRRHVAGLLRQKEVEGVLSLRFDAESVVTYMFAAADGCALQRLTDPERDYSATVTTGTEVARFLLTWE